MLGWTSRPSVSPLKEIYSRVAFSIYVHKSEFSFLNFILVVTARQAPISESAMPALGFQMDAGRVRRSILMLRKTMIVLLTAAALTGGLTADAFARGGGGGGGGHGGGYGGSGHMGGGFSGAHMGGGFGGENFAGRGMALGRGFAGLYAETRGHFDHDHFHRGPRFGFGGGYDDWCSEYPYYTPNCYPYGG
jgi:hypothetical protein